MALLLVSGAFLFPISVMGGKSITFDEVVHLPAGLSYLRTRRIALNPMHPPLVKEICAVPLLFLDAKLPATAHGETLSILQYSFGAEFFKHVDIQRVLFWGRLPVVLLSVALAALVIVWATDLWGRTGGLLAGVLYVFDPTIAAHAQLVTTDVAFAFFSTLFLFLLRHYFAARSQTALIVAGAALGLALSAKFSAVALLPVAVILVTFAQLNRHSHSRALNLARGLAIIVSLFVTSYVVLWTTYFFPSDPTFYLQGLATVQQDHDPNYRPVFLGHLLRSHERYGYLLVAWLIKSPLPSLVLLLWATIAFVGGRRSTPLNEALLVVPAVGLFAVISLLADPLGVRYAIPCFPLFFVFSGRIATYLENVWSWKAGAIGLLILWQITEFVTISPDHLSYFNQVAGGSRGGVRWLDGSNVDWGQGLIQLRSYLRTHPVGNYRFGYYGSIDPALYGIDGTRIRLSEVVDPSEADFPLIASAHYVTRARALWLDLHPDGPPSWLDGTEPEVIGHAYYLWSRR